LALSAALFVLYLGYSMMATPLAAWMGELSGAYHERTRITTYAQALTCVALLLRWCCPACSSRAWPASPGWSWRRWGRWSLRSSC
jgi:Na+/melibiose symporter-like transporter